MQGVHVFERDAKTVIDLELTAFQSSGTGRPNLVALGC
jgi:hypothetical protein